MDICTVLESAMQGRTLLEQSRGETVWLRYPSPFLS